MNAAAPRALAILSLLALAGATCNEPTTAGESGLRVESVAQAEPTEPGEPGVWGQWAEPADEVKVELELIGEDGKEQRSFAAESRIRLRVTLRNPTEREVSLAFSSGRTHDAVVLGADGSELWRWSQGRRFTQVLSEQQLAPGSESSAELICDLSGHGGPVLPPGRYRAAGMVPAFGEELRSRLIEFEVK